MNRVCLIDGCYSAEESVGEWEPITLDGTVSFIEAVTSSVWWTDAFPRSVPVEVIEGGDEPSDARGLGFIRSFAYPVGGFTPERRVISMHPSMLDSRILIHELAHCASASTHGDFDRIHEGHMARGRYPLTPEIGHGIGDFAACFLRTQEHHFLLISLMSERCVTRSKPSRRVDRNGFSRVINRSAETLARWQSSMNRSSVLSTR